MFVGLKHQTEKSKQKLKDNKSSWILSVGISKNVNVEKLTLNKVKASNKKIDPKKTAKIRYCLEPCFNSDIFIFNIIKTNRKRTAIAPT